MNDLILQIKYGGLGDNLFYSHLPRIAKETGAYDRVFISSRSAFRNQEIKKLVWDLNPYLDGYVDAEGIYPDIDPSLPHGGNLLDQIMIECGLDDGLLRHEPEIYYRPKFIPEYHLAIYDPNYISNDGLLSRAGVVKHFVSNKIKLDAAMKDITPTPIALPEGMFNSRRITTPTLFDLCDLLHSCKEFYCLVSGSATLASALGKGVTVLVGHTVGRMFLHSKLHKYVLFPRATRSQRFIDFMYLKIAR